MKVTVLSFVAAALGLAAQVSAGPIRIYVLAPEHADVVRSELAALPAPDAAVAHLRWGHAAAGAPQSITQPTIKIIGMHSDNSSRPVRKHRCGGGMRMKAITFSNWLREKVGLEPIMPPPPHLHFAHGRPMGHRLGEAHGDTKTTLPSSFHEGAQIDGEGRVVDGRPHFHHYHHAHHHHHRPSTFTGRLQQALMTLGPWEGRFIAFVIGCGIGSLLRMFYVLCIVAFRSLALRKKEDEYEVIFAEVEEALPPKYVPNGRIALEDDKVQLE